ncbi:hypothetical protein VY86_18680 [Photorhabdus thracensis]|uniref:Uncharacterized protein n=1 Tax=Photorhabdus thracensis TaxID=230089 RepID=A0A0F7LT81_9GAMM|nr:hypothetical protein VY86_18680 [Photorhabdus thracensis]
MNILTNTINFIMISLFLVSMFATIFIRFLWNKEDILHRNQRKIYTKWLFYTTNYICNIVFQFFWQLLSIMFLLPDNNWKEDYNISFLYR